MATQLDNDPLVSCDTGYFQYTLPRYYRSVLKEFRKVSRSFVNFNFFFFIVIVAELSAFFASLPLLHRSVLFAISLSVFFLTCFSYCVLLFYFQARKPEQILRIKDRFLQSCRQILSSSSGEGPHHLSIAEAFSKLSNYLHDFEWNFYKIPSIFQFAAPFISKISAYFYWEDVFEMKQLLLCASVDEHLQQIRLTPTDLEVHASLASVYVSFAKLYKDPMPSSDHPRNHRARKLQPFCEEQFKIYSRLAMEEFKILSHYASNDPWVHEQMALGYRDLGIPEEEVKEVELLLKLRPQDKEILFRLGSLYFQQGMNAKGLQVYEDLKKNHFKKAEDLISSYGTFKI